MAHAPPLPNLGQISDADKDALIMALWTQLDAALAVNAELMADRARNTAEEREGRHMTLTEGLADLRRIGLEKARIRVRQVHGKEMCLTLDPGDDDLGLAEVHLRVAGIVGQGHEDLAALRSRRSRT